MTVEKITTRREELNITEITLLSVEEYENAMDNIKPISEIWWLRSPGISNYFAALVRGDGELEIGGLGVDYEGGVRPALRINLKSSDFQTGDSFQFGEYTWTIISDDYALCDTLIDSMRFRKDWQSKGANDYEKSDIKNFLDEWYTKQISHTNEKKTKTMIDAKTDHLKSKPCNKMCRRFEFAPDECKMCVYNETTNPSAKQFREKKEDEMRAWEG